MLRAAKAVAEEKKRSGAIATLLTGSLSSRRIRPGSDVDLLVIYEAKVPGRWREMNRILLGESLDILNFDKGTLLDRLDKLTGWWELLWGATPLYDPESISRTIKRRLGASTLQSQVTALCQNCFAPALQAALDEGIPREAREFELRRAYLSAARIKATVKAKRPVTRWDAVIEPMRTGDLWQQLCEVHAFVYDTLTLWDWLARLTLIRDESLLNAARVVGIDIPNISWILQHSCSIWKGQLAKAIGSLTEGSLEAVSVYLRDAAWEVGRLRIALHEKTIPSKIKPDSVLALIKEDMGYRPLFDEIQSFGLSPNKIRRLAADLSQRMQESYPGPDGIRMRTPG